MQDNTNQGIAAPSVPQQPVSPPTAATPAPLSSHPQGEMINAGEEIKDPPKKSRKLLFVVLALVLLVALVVGGLFVYRTLFGAKVLEENLIVAQTPTPEAMKNDDMNDWETYINDKFKFSFPKNLPETDRVVELVENENYVELSSSPNWGLNIHFDDERTIEDVIDNIVVNQTDSLKDLGIVKFNTYDSRQLELSTDMGIFHFILLDRDDGVIWIEYLKNINTVDQILSTFEFVD